MLSLTRGHSDDRRIVVIRPLISGCVDYPAWNLIYEGENSMTDLSEEPNADQRSEEPKPPKGLRSLCRRRIAGALLSGFPRHRLSQCLRIPTAVIERSLGLECTDREAARYAGLRLVRRTRQEITSAIKYGLLERRSPGRVNPTDIARKIVAPRTARQKTAAMRKAILHAPLLSDLYKCFRGSNLPDLPSLVDSLRSSFNVPSEDIHSVVLVLVESLADANLLESVDGKQHVIGFRQKAATHGTVSCKD